MVGKRLAHYEIVALLGKGGMGEVYRAHDTTLERDVAIKVLPAELAADADRLARFRREARVLASLNHPNIAGIHGLQEADGRSFLVMELAEGQDLSQRLAAGPIPLEEALAIAGQITAGLEEAHEKGIVHRDLKPANVMVAPDGQVKILDFGLARAYLGETASEGDPAMSPTMTAGLTQAGVILGSAAYMSPEQAKGQPVDRRTDIWAFGVVLFEMLSGRSLFGAETISEAMAAVLKEPVDWDQVPDDVPPSIRALLGRCLERDPRLRLRDIGEARIHLQDPEGSSMLMAAGSGPQLAPERPRGGRGRVALPWALLAVACLVFTLAWTRAGGGADDTGPAPRVVRSSLESPPGTGFHLTGANPAPMVISPDGTRVVFGARDDQGTHRLWLRDLALPLAEPITGTGNAQYPFWSADGNAVGYFADGALRVVDLVARTNRTVTTAPDGKGGCWLPDGTILYTPSSTAEILRVRADGSAAPETITDLDAEPRSNSHRLPTPLPGGTHYLFAARAVSQNSPGSVAVMVGSLAGQPPRLLLHADGQARFVAGHLLYLTGSSLYARPFDPGSLEFTGSPVLVADDVGAVPGAALGLYSASASGNLIYHPGHRETMTVRLVWYDAAGKRLGELGESAGFGTFAISPDGTRMAFTDYDNPLGDGDIWLHDLEQDVRTRVTFETADESFPVWAPDGQTLYYVHSEAGRNQLIAFRPDGREPGRPIFDGGSAALTLTDVSPDGRTLAFMVRDTVSSVDRVVVMPVDGSAAPTFIDETAGTTMVARFSPDGRWIAYASRESGDWSLYLKTFPVTDRKWQLTQRDAFWFQWHPDGHELYFQWAGREVYAVALDLTGNTPRIGGTRVHLDDFPPPMTGLHTFDITPDGQRFLVSDAGGSDDSRPVRLIQGWTRIVERVARRP
jgi:Tol biopolymer transport system component